jgi:hypothetical protein
MRSNRAFIIFLLSLFCINLNAQLFIGGSVRFNSSNTNHNGTASAYKTSTYDIMIMPRIGKFLTEKLAIGLDLDLAFNGQKTDLNPGSNSNSYGLGLSPFLRFYALRWNKFSVYGEGNLGMSFSISKNKVAGVISNGPKNALISLGIHPGLSYDISKKISLETSLNFLSLGYNYSISKNGSSTDKSLNYNFGAGLGNIISLNAITIGGIFKF